MRYAKTFLAVFGLALAAAAAIPAVSSAVESSAIIFDNGDVLIIVGSDIVVI